MFHQDGPSFFELARQALSSTQRGYDLLAPKFDYTPFRTPDFVLERVVELIADFGPFDEALDLCCGTGAAMGMFAPHCKRRIVGIDFSQGMLDVAKSNLAKESNDIELEWVKADVMKMEFENQFDLAFSFGAFGHVQRKDEAEFVSRVNRALRVGGKFVFVTGEMPSKLGATYWLARSFNAAMRIRNALIRPQFVMYYLTFMWPDVSVLLQDNGFTYRVIDMFEEHAKLKHLKLIVAEKR